jgi:hypothetical protein
MASWLGWATEWWGNCSKLHNQMNVPEDMYRHAKGRKSYGDYDTYRAIGNAALLTWEHPHKPLVLMALGLCEPPPAETAPKEPVVDKENVEEKAEEEEEDSKSMWEEPRKNMQPISKEKQLHIELTQQCVPLVYFDWRAAVTIHLDKEHNRENKEAFEILARWITTPGLIMANRMKRFDLDLALQTETQVIVEVRVSQISDADTWKYENPVTQRPVTKRGGRK